MSEEFEISVEIPIDDDGFMRRLCPHCGREFKWHYSEPGQGGEPEPADGYFCPYCAKQGDEWMTEAQSEWAAAQATNAVSEKLFDGLSNSSFLKVERNPVHAKKPLEVNDMERVDFECHPREPIKVLDGWDEAIHCVVCGQSDKRRSE